VNGVDLENVQRADRGDDIALARAPARSLRQAECGELREPCGVRRDAERWARVQ
jgi:hypothetical protein